VAHKDAFEIESSVRGIHPKLPRFEQDSFPSSDDVYDDFIKTFEYNVV